MFLKSPENLGFPQSVPVSRCQHFGRLPISWQFRLAEECRSRMPYCGVNARSSSRAASLKSFSGSIPAPLFIRSCNSRKVLFGAKYELIVASMIFSADATVRGEDRTRILLIRAE